MTVEEYKAAAVFLGVDRGPFSDDRQFEPDRLTATTGTSRWKGEPDKQGGSIKHTAISLGLVVEDLSHLSYKKKHCKQ